MQRSGPATASADSTEAAVVHQRLQLDRDGARRAAATLADDVRRGLQLRQKALPPKYFYDDRGARLFDAICDLPEYYLTRTEQALLEQVIHEVLRLARPAEVVEFGSGAARKTRTVLDALTRQRAAVRYVPVDVSAGMLRRAARALLRDYPQLRVHALVGDYERDLDRLPAGMRRLVLFLGSTIGNLLPEATVRFLASLRRQLAAGDYFLLGVDLVKPPAVLEAAYNDHAGLTAEFNRNILRVINRQLAADFAPERFDHVAFFNREQSQIEMHLRARGAQRVTIGKLDLRVAFAAGETIHTEISRKFTPEEVAALLRTTGYAPLRWYTSPNAYFGLALAGVA